jgi:hypothetical protein
MTRLRRAEHGLEREQQQEAGHKMDVAVSIGTALLGAVFGRKRLSATTASRVGTAVRRAGRSSKERGDIERATENVEALRRELAELERKFEDDVDALAAAYDAQQEDLEPLTIKPKPGGVHVELVGIGWTPT